MSKISCIKVIIQGRVQGVFFRAETQKAARLLNLRGYVKNLGDGSVEAVFQGEEDAVKKMITWCNTGSPASRVDHVLSEPAIFNPDSDDFDILY
jgi:acylphosphatase